MSRSPTQTAAPIARIRAMEGSRPDALFSDPYAAHFDEGVGDVTDLFLSIPFFTEHVRLRTRYFDDAVRAALAGGVKRIVLLGAGFDCRALRLPEIMAAGATVVEVDHGAQLDEKRRRLSGAGLHLPAHVIPAPADLSVSGELDRALSGAGLGAAERVLWICEGLFGYLALADLEQLAERTAKWSGPGSILVANHNISSWSTEVVQGAFTAAGWRQEPAPSFAELHRAHFGSDGPSGSEAFALLAVVATRAARPQRFPTP